jgi:hypothetical protein
MHSCFFLLFCVLHVLCRHLDKGLFLLIFDSSQHGVVLVYNSVDSLGIQFSVGSPVLRGVTLRRVFCNTVI